jgi:hypothetical protein
LPFKKYIYDAGEKYANFIWWQTNKFTALEHLLSSPFNSLRMSPLSPLSVIPATRPKPGSDVVELLREGGGNVVDEAMPEADEVNSKELADEEVSNTATTMTEEGEVVRVAEEDLVGRTTTNLNEIAMRLLTSSLTGKCWRRSISTVWLS